MKLVVAIGAVFAVVVGFLVRKLQRGGTDVWHDATNG
jgi:hypothetical protein